MARAIWKGTISFGLVNIPIALYPATRREELKFRLLRKPVDGVLVLELMHFADELADPGKLDVPKKTEVGKRETNMAKSLIDSMSSKWNPEKYKDDYREALMEVIEEKVEAGGKEIEEKPKKAPKPTKVIDLVSVLQKSLEQTGGAKKRSLKKTRTKHTQREKKAA